MEFFVDQIAEALTQEEAAMAYDIAAIKHRGLNAVTNFDVSRYIKWHHRCHADDAGGLNIPLCVNDRLQPPQVSPTSHAASALGPLLQSPRLKEMERVAASQSNTNSPSSSSCPPSPPPPTTQRQESKPRNSSTWCSFPDDVQTYFRCDDEEGMSGYAEVDTFLFGDLSVCAGAGPLI